MPTPSELPLALIDEAFDHKAWHGTTLFGALRGLTPEAAAWRPAPRRHNIWEIAVHAAYWKYAVRRVLTGDKRGTFACKGSNWFARQLDGDAARAWAADMRLLVDEHRRLRDAVATLPHRALGTRLSGERYSAAFMIRGISAHDLYHAGQVQLIKRLRSRSR